MGTTIQTGKGFRDPLIDCPVVIIKGINKSLVGIIKDVNGEMCRIELQSGNKTVMINKMNLLRKECVMGSSIRTF